MRYKEAAKKVEQFLDHHVQVNRSCTIYIITGAGRHSPGNVPVLKELTITLLKERSLR